MIGRVHRGFFMPKVCLWRAGEGSSNARRAQAVRQPEPDRHPIGVGRRVTTRLEQTIMNTPSMGAIRPSAESIEQAILLAESATGILERNPAPNTSRTAAAALIEAGTALLWNQGKENCGAVYLIPDRLHADLFNEIEIASHALSLAMASDGMSDGAEAVIGLVRDSLENIIRQIDISNLDKAGLCVDFEEARHE
jgi:hypothetical protein